VKTCNTYIVGGSQWLPERPALCKIPRSSKHADSGACALRMLAAQQAAPTYLPTQVISANTTACAVLRVSPAPAALMESSATWACVTTEQVKRTGHHTAGGKRR
jgi:hypothetical protein